jgi:hypothetical protein
VSGATVRGGVANMNAVVSGRTNGIIIAVTVKDKCLGAQGFT